MLEMAAPIQSSAKCEQCSVVRFLNAKDERPAEIHKQTVAVCGNVMNFHLFLRLKKHLAGKKFNDDDEVQEEVMTSFKKQTADFYDSGIQKLVPRLNTCLDNAGDNFENKVMYRQFIHSVALHAGYLRLKSHTQVV